MTIDLSIVISLISVVCALTFGLSSFNRANRSEAEKGGRIQGKLDSIEITVKTTDKKVDRLSGDLMETKEAIATIKADQDAQRESIQKAHDRISELRKEIYKK